MCKALYAHYLNTLLSIIRPFTGEETEVQKN